MKKYILILLLVFASCADNDKLSFSVDKPESIEQYEYLDRYDPLKNYVDRENTPNFKLGTGVSMSDFNKQGVIYRLISNNYDEITPGYGMKHGAIVQSDGSLDLSSVSEFIESAKKANVSIFGHALCWHANQNAEYLNGLIQPALEENLFSNSDFETGNIDGWIGWGNNSERGISEEGEGFGGKGYSLWIKNPTKTNFWEAQVRYDLPSMLQKGSEYILSMKVRGTAKGTIKPEVQGENYNADSFGDIHVTKEWQSVELSLVPSEEDRVGFIVSVGEFEGTIFIDNISLRRFNPMGGGDKTEEEKKEIITNELEKFIAGMMEETKHYITAWDVVNEPMSDWPDPSKIKTGVGKPELSSDEFYWQDYLGKEYAAKVIEFARKYGNPDDLLFINDYGLESSDMKKCKGLISFIEYTESLGVRVDGIGTQMHVSLATDRSAIKEMFTLLASTRKLIKISELDMGIGDNIQTEDVTFEQLLEQADLYKYIIDTYKEVIPIEFQYGITHWSPTDSPKDSFWRAGEPIGLWTLDYKRKPVYAAFCEALSNNKIFPEK